MLHNDLELTTLRCVLLSRSRWSRFFEGDNGDLFNGVVSLQGKRRNGEEVLSSIESAVLERLSEFRAEHTTKRFENLLHQQERKFSGRLIRLVGLVVLETGDRRDVDIVMLDDLASTAERNFEEIGDD